MPRSAPTASAVRIVSWHWAGPIETATISLALPCSFMRTASSTAISSKGFIDILTLAVSTPEPSALTRTFTLKSTTRLTATRIFIAPWCYSLTRDYRIRAREGADDALVGQPAGRSLGRIGVRGPDHSPFDRLRAVRLRAARPGVPSLRHHRGPVQRRRRRLRRFAARPQRPGGVRATQHGDVSRQLEHRAPARCPLHR